MEGRNARAADAGLVRAGIPWCDVRLGTVRPGMWARDRKQSAFSAVAMDGVWTAMLLSASPLLSPLLLTASFEINPLMSFVEGLKFLWCTC